MKSIIVLLAGLLSAAPLFAAEASGPQTEEQKTLYALGVWLAQKVQPFNLSQEDLPYVEMGLSDTVLGKKPAVDLDAYGDKLNDLARSRMESAAGKNKKEGEAYAAKVAKMKGAKTEPDGLIYIITKKGKGEHPKATDTVKVNYEGKLVDGTVFDSSYARHEPAEFPLDGVIKCWTEGVQKMRPGGEARFICPASIAYGDMGRPGIPPGATLDFKVELLSIKPGEAKPSPMAPAGNAPKPADAQ